MQPGGCRMEVEREIVLDVPPEEVWEALTELAGELPVTRQAVSKHLAMLGQAGLVESSRSGRETRYRLTPQPLTEALAWMERIGDRWDERLARLRDHLAPG